MRTFPDLEERLSSGASASSSADRIFTGLGGSDKWEQIMKILHINESILSEEILEDQKKNRIDHMTYLAGYGRISDQKYSDQVDSSHGSL